MNPSKTSNETVLVTGGAGFIGTYLCESLIAQGHRVISLDLKGEAARPINGVHYFRGDVRNLMRVRSIIKEYGITALYHLAATVSVPVCQKNPMDSYSNNVESTLSVLEACRLSEHPIRFAFASSAALYGSLGDNLRPLSEDRISDRFSSFYAAQKHASEKMIELYTSSFRLKSLIFRFFNVYGYGQDPESPYSGVITIFSKLARENRAIHLQNGGIQTRDFVPVTEVANAIASALKLPETDWNASVINIGSGVSTSIRKLAYTIRTLSQSKSPILDASPREGDVLHSLADIRKARELLSFRSSNSLTDRLEDLLS